DKTISDRPFAANQSTFPDVTRCRMYGSIICSYPTDASKENWIVFMNLTSPMDELDPTAFEPAPRYGMLALGVGAYRIGGTKPSNASSRLGRLPTPRGNGETSAVVTAPTRADGKSKRLPHSDIL